MNHGIINKKFFGSLSEEDMFQLHPELKKMHYYFSALKARDRYYNAMKYHAVHLCKFIYPEITLEKLGFVLNMNYTNTIHYLKHYIPLEGHKEFIKNEFDHCIENGLYPITVEYYNQKTHGKYRKLTLKEYNLHIENKTKKKEEYARQASIKKKAKEKFDFYKS